jgi:ElaB/YqjD/DUF883 family membrane-anchored ribosome-binding protein
MNDDFNPTFGSTPPPHDPFAAAKASALKAAEELRHAATAKAQEFRSVAEQRSHEFREKAENKAGEFKDYADKAWSGASTQASDYAAEAERFAKEKPMQALLTAFGAGLLLGIILKR